MKRPLKPLAIVLLATTALFGVWIIGRDDSIASDEPQVATVPAAEDKPLPIVAGLGIVEPAGGMIELASELPGVITTMHVAEGDRVKSGEVVAELGNAELKAKVAQAKAQLAIREADLARVENGSRLQEIAQAESRVAELRADLEMTEGDYQRAVQLQKSGTLSKRALQAAGTTRTVARKQLDAAAQALSLLKEGARFEEIAAARAEVAFARHQLAEAEAYWEKSFIRASSDGTVLRLFREAGEAVSTQPATALAEIGDTSKLIVRAQIDEAEIAELAVGQMAEIDAPAFGGRRLTGRIVRLSSRIGAKIVEADTAGEKRDTRVLDVIVELDPGVAIPVNLRVDVYIYPSSHVASIEREADPVLASWILRP